MLAVPTENQQERSVERTQRKKIMENARVLDVDDVNAIIVIRRFIDTQLAKLCADYVNDDGVSTVDKEVLAALFSDVYRRYTQSADIAQHLYQLFAELSAQIDDEHEASYIEAKKAEGDFNVARNEYINAVMRMKAAYRNLNDQELEYELNEVITSYQPEVERSHFRGDCVEFWGGGNGQD